MKLWPVVALATISSAFVWACQGDDTTPDDGGGMGGEGTGGAATGGNSSGGAVGSGGDGGDGGFGGTPTCEPDEAMGGDGGVGGAESSEIFGSWTDQYGSTYTIDESTVDSGYAVFDVAVVNDDGMYIVAQNDPAGAYYPCLYSRFDWYIDGGETYWCRSVLGAESIALALAAAGADREDLATGCSGFPWSVLTPQ